MAADLSKCAAVGPVNIWVVGDGRAAHALAKSRRVLLVVPVLLLETVLRLDESGLTPLMKQMRKDLASGKPVDALKLVPYFLAASDRARNEGYVLDLTGCATGAVLGLGHHSQRARREHARPGVDRHRSIPNR